jgi:hypothetical protein
MVANATENTPEDTDATTAAKTVANMAEETPEDSDTITGAADSVVEALDLWATSPAAIFLAGASLTRSTFNW